MIYRNIKTGAEIISQSIIHAPGFVLVDEKIEKAASSEDCHIDSPFTAESPLKEEAPAEEQPKKKTGTKKKGTKK